MSKILIIGGSGYLGRHLSKILNQKNEVFITSRFKNKNNFSLVFDLEDSSTFDKIDFNSFDMIFMLISSMKGIQSNIMDDNSFDLNCNSYKNLLNYFVKINYSKYIVYISSMTVYSSDNISPVNENGNKDLPPSSYGLSKLFAEQLTKFYCSKNKFKGVIIRIPGLFGGDRKNGFIYNAIDKISKNEDFYISTENLKYWETIAVTDASDMIQVFLNNYKWEKDCDDWNICYGHETDIIELAYFIKDKLGSTSKISSTIPKGYKSFFLSNKKYLNLTNNYFKSFNKSLLDYMELLVK